MEKSSFFTSLNGDRKYKATDWAAYFANFIGNGVFPNPSSALRVNTNGDMTVSLSPGHAFIKGYAYTNTDNLVLTISPSDAVLSRIDRVVVRCDFVNREITTKVKAGVFNSNPVPPNLQRDEDAYELALCNILIDPGARNIAQSKITDLVLDSNLCGIVAQTVQTIDTTELFRKLDAFIEERGHDVLYWIDQSTGKWEKDFMSWFNTIKDVLDKDVAGNLTNRILALEDQLKNGLKAENMQMNDGNTVEKNVTDIRNKVNAGQNFKLTRDDGKYIEDTSRVNLDNFFTGWKNLYNVTGTLPAELDPNDNNVIVECKGTDPNFTRQLCYDVRSIRAWQRLRFGGTWNPWRRL